MTIPNAKHVHITVDPRVPVLREADLTEENWRKEQAILAKVPPEEGGPTRPDRFVFTFVLDDGQAIAVRLNGRVMHALGFEITRAIDGSRNRNGR